MPKVAHTKIETPILVGITPGGICSYLSPGYGGWTSDWQIIDLFAPYVMKKFSHLKKRKTGCLGNLYWSTGRLLQKEFMLSALSDLLN